MLEFPESEFWDFSTRIYANEKVARACLALQERHGVDVNVVLFCLWAGASGRSALTGAELGRLLQAVEVWQRRVVLGLRELRRWLKGDVAPAPRALADGLRRAVASTEIDAEHVEQLVLSRALGQAPERRADAAEGARCAARNLEAYLAALGVLVGASDRADAAVLLAAAFPESADGLIAELSRLDSGGAAEGLKDDG